jgi:hypothetical protein
LASAAHPSQTIAEHNLQENCHNQASALKRHTRAPAAASRTTKQLIRATTEFSCSITLTANHVDIVAAVLVLLILAMIQYLFVEAHVRLERFAKVLDEKYVLALLLRCTNNR